MKNLQDPRHQARRLALAYIYAFKNQNADQDITPFLRILKVKEYNEDLFIKLVQGYKDNTDKLKDYTKDLLKSWTPEQLLEIDLTIIEMATLEFLILRITPVKVAVDEAIELSKEFGSDKSNKFVNGVLAKVINNNS